MRIAALGDIHGNHIALENCLNWIGNNNIDGIAFLGDYISDFPYPQKTISLLRDVSLKYKTWFIRGNREDYMINHHKNPNDDWCYNSQSGSLLYTYENLTNNDIAFFEQLPISTDIDIIQSNPITICHGSPNSNRALFNPNTAEIDEVMTNLNNSLLICGHSHQPFIYQKRGKTIANGGSVGLTACNGQTNSHFIVAEYKNSNWNVEIISLKYDIDKAIKEFYESDLITKGNIWTKAIIATMKTGVDYNGKCISIINKICKERNQPFNTEEIWIEAAKIIELEKIVKE